MCVHVCISDHCNLQVSENVLSKPGLLIFVCSDTTEIPCLWLRYTYGEAKAEERREGIMFCLHLLHPVLSHGVSPTVDPTHTFILTHLGSGAEGA